MKAIILAAGSGTRMGKYTQDLPKGMLSINNKPLIEWQIQHLMNIGINDIVIVTGYKAETIKYSGIKYYHNHLYAQSNMVESLLCAREEFDTDILVCYSDIIYTSELAQLVCNANAEIAVAVDKSWRDYWMLRYGSTETDLESLSVDSRSNIIELGKELVSSSGLEYRYVGLIKFSADGISKAVDLYERKKINTSSWVQSGKPFLKGYMTDLLHEMIMDQVDVKAVISEGGWLEFDTERDYEVINDLIISNQIDKNLFD